MTTLEKTQKSVDYVLEKFHNGDFIFEYDYILFDVNRSKKTDRKMFCQLINKLQHSYAFCLCDMCGEIIVQGWKYDVDVFCSNHCLGKFQPMCDDYEWGYFEKSNVE